MLIAGPLTAFMNAVSFVESARQRLILQSKGLAPTHDPGIGSVDELRRVNFNLLIGGRAVEVIVEYSAILEAHPQSELLEPFGLTFGDLFPKLFVTMTDTYRRMCLFSKQCKFEILEIGFMTVEDASDLLLYMSSLPDCCSGDSFVQAVLSFTENGADLEKVNAVVELFQDALFYIPASSVEVEKLHACTQRNCAAFKAGRSADNIHFNSFIMSTALEHSQTKELVEKDAFGEKRYKVGKLLRTRIVTSTNVRRAPRQSQRSRTTIMFLAIA